MLQIFPSSRGIKAEKLMNLYFAESLCCSSVFYKAQQDFYSYLLEFLKQENSFYAVWEENDRYISALRMEPYRDGLLVEGLVTAPQLRGNGYAKELLIQVLAYADMMGCKKIYSHIRKDNVASVKVHTACNFEKLYSYAAYIDGSVDHRSDTYLYEIL